MVGWAVVSVPMAAGAEPSTDDPTTVVVAPLVVDGTLPDNRRTELNESLRTGLTRGGFELAQAPGQLASCETASCRARVAREAGADYAVGMTVTVQGRDYAIGLTVIDAATAAVVAESAERCEVCGFAEVQQLVDGQAAAVGSRLDALALEPPVLVFDSDPPGAVIRVDGQVVGATPMERVVEPGRHVVRAERDGYVAEQREVEAVVGVRATVRLELEPIPRTHRDRRLRIAGWSTLGAGVAAVAIGVPLIVVHGRPNRLACDGDDVDPLGNCRFLHATRGPGIGVVALGGALVATGVTLLVVSRDRSRSAARLSLTAGWARVGVHGRF